jgi:hypothetical protein
MGLVLHLQLLQRHHLTCDNTHTHESIGNTHKPTEQPVISIEGQRSTSGRPKKCDHTHPPQPPTPNTGLVGTGGEALACVALNHNEGEKMPHPCMGCSAECRRPHKQNKSPRGGHGRQGANGVLVEGGVAAYAERPSHVWGWHGAGVS